MKTSETLTSTQVINLQQMFLDGSIKLQRTGGAHHCVFVDTANFIGC